MNYCLLYGGGKKTAAKTIRMWHADYPEAKALQKADALLGAFKGKKARGTNVFIGGTASQAFNKMLDLLSQPEPATPLLGTRLPPAMWPANSGNNGSPGQLNATVQQTGSSALHCILVGNWWIAKRAGIISALGVTIHDEFHYNVLAHQIKLFAYCQQIVHMWMWTLLNYNLGIYELAIAPLFASAIAADTVFRKEASAGTATPSSPKNVPPGKEYTMDALCKLGMPAELEKVFDGKLDKFSTV